MPFHPMPFYRMARGKINQFMPQFGIANRFLAGINPPALFPAVDPFGDPVDQIFAVGIQRHFAWFDQGGQTLNRGGHLHAIIGRIRLPARKFFFMRAHPQ